MKVGILTFHNAYNYGAVLQAYATQTFIKGLGHEAEIIDYHNKEIDSSYDKARFHFSTLPKRKFYLIPKYCLGRFYYWKKRKAYESFKKKHLIISKQRFNQYERICFKSYNAILIGSDQLWNPTLTNGFDSVYWGDFLMEPRNKKIAWAVCMNSLRLNEEQMEYVKSHLRFFSNISVREASLKQLLSTLSPKAITQLIDPVFLLDSKQWETLCQPVKKKNFIAVYALLNEEETIHAAEEIASVLGKEVVIIEHFSHFFPNKKREEKLGPIDFLSLINAADCIITSSFHGTAFSLIFGKPFFCIEPEGTNNIRIRSLLDTFKQSNRILSQKNVHLINEITPPDPEEIRRITQELKKNAIDFFNGATATIGH